MDQPGEDIDPDRIDNRIELGRALTRLRDGAGLSIRDVAARTGIRLSTLSGYYRGKHAPQVRPPEVLTLILTVCGISDTNLLERWRKAVDRARRRPGRPAGDAPAPYLGLAHYQPHHATLFHGRDDLVESILARLSGNYLRGGPLFVIGESGSGKSSLLRAGLIPAVEAGRLPASAPGEWRWLLMSPGGDPCQELAGQFADAIEIGVDELANVLREAPGDAAATLRRAVSPAEAGAGVTGVLLVVDQFDELFTVCTDAEERVAFIDALCALAEPAPKGQPAVLVVLGMRADFFQQATHHPQLAKVLPDNQVLITPLTEQELREVITAPARLAGLDIEPGLVELVLRDAEGHGPGALPLLSHALLVTWEDREQTQLTVRGYQDGGGIRKAVAASADQAYNTLDAADQDLARLIFLSLVHLGDRAPDTRRRVSLDELRFARPPAESARIVNRFVAHRLLTISADGVELSHDALIREWPRLREWLDTDRLGLRIHRQLGEAARNWQEADRDPALLYRGSQRDNALTWADDPAHGGTLIELERQFLTEIREQHAAELHAVRRRSRRRWTLALVVSVLVLLASVLSGYVVAQNKAAVREHDLAESVQLAQQADLFRGSDVSLSMQLALAAYRISPTPQAKASLLDSVAVPAGTRLLGPSQVLQAVAVTPDNRVLASAGTRGTIQLWDLANRQRPTRLGSALTGSTDTVYSLAFSPDGRLLADGGADGVLRLWDVSDPAHPIPIGTPLVGAANTIYSIVFSPNGRLLAAGSADNTVRLWDLTDARRPATLGPPLTGFGNYVQAVAFSPDSGLLAAGSADQTVRLWSLADPRDPTPLGTPLTGATSTVFSVAFSPDGRTLAEGGEDHLIRLWNLADPAHPVALGSPLAGATGWVNAIVFSGDGRTLAAASSDNAVRLWNVSTARVVQTLPHPSPVTALAFLTGNQTLATAAADGEIRLWSLPGPIIANRADTVFSLAYAASGNTLAVSAGSQSNTVELWDTRDPRHPTMLGSPIVDPPGDSPYAGSLALSPNGRITAIGGKDGSIQLWDVSEPQHPRMLGTPLPATGKVLQSLEFSPDDGLLATGGNDDVVRLWDMRQPNRPVLLRTLTGPANYVFNVAFSADGRLLAAGSADDKVWLWDISTPTKPKRLPTVTGFSSYVYAVAFSPRSPLLAVGSADKSVRLVDLTDPEHPVDIGSPLIGATSYVYSVTFSPNGRTLVVGSLDHTVLLWDVSQPSRPTLIATLAAATDSVFVVVVSPDGRTIAAGTAEQAVRLWSTDPTKAAAEVCAAAGDPITRAEWAQYVPDRPYQPPC